MYLITKLRLDKVCSILGKLGLPFWCGNQNIAEELVGQYHGCWCPDSLSIARVSSAIVLSILDQHVIAVFEEHALVWFKCREIIENGNMFMSMAQCKTAVTPVHYAINMCPP